MPRLTVAEEAAALALLAPSREELATVEESIATLLAGITRDGAGRWRVDPALSYLVTERLSAGRLVQAARRGRTVLRTAERMLSTA